MSRDQCRQAQQGQRQQGGYFPNLPPEINSVITKEVNRGKPPKERFRQSARLATVNKEWRDWYHSDQYSSKDRLANEIVQAVAGRNHVSLWFALEAAFRKNTPSWAHDDQVMRRVFQKIYEYENEGPDGMVYSRALERDNIDFFKMLMKHIPIPVDDILNEQDPEMFVKLVQLGLVNVEDHKYPADIEWAKQLQKVGVKIWERPDLLDLDATSFKIHWYPAAQALGDDYYRNIFIPNMWHILLNHTLVDYSVSRAIRFIDTISPEQLAEIAPHPFTVAHITHIMGRDPYEDECFDLVQTLARKGVRFDPDIAAYLTKLVGKEWDRRSVTKEQVHELLQLIEANNSSVGNVWS